MKKILSFLTKKPLALAAVALFSVSAFADEATGGPASTPKEKLTPVEMWAKVSATNPLHYFDRVTVVDDRPSVNLAYADDGEVQIAPVPFKTEAGGTSLPKNASYFWVAQGTKDEFFSLSKHLKQDADGVYQRIVGYDPVTGLEVYGPVDYKEGETPTEGAYGDGAYMDEDGKILYPTSDLVNEICWQWKEMSSDYYLFNASNRQRYAYYNTKENLFKTTDTESGIYKAKLYKVVNVFAPYFKDPEGPQKLKNEGDTYKAEIINPNKGGDLMYRFEGEGDDAWKPYPDGGVPCETGKETTIETKIDFEGGSTPIVGQTFVPVYVPAPEITAELDGDGNLKINKDGEAPVNIKSEDGTTLTYSVGTGKATELDTNEKDVDLAYIADQDPNKTPVTAIAVKEVEYTPWPTKTSSKTTATVNSDPTTKEFTVVKFADASDVFTEIQTEPVKESKVPLGQPIQLWYDITASYKDVYTIKANRDVKILKLKFEGIEKPYEADVTFVGEKMQFSVPDGEDYANKYFDVTAEDGAYFAFTGTAEDPKNKVETKAATVRFYTGLAAKSWTIDPKVKYLTTDENTVEVRVWPSNKPEDTPVDFSSDAKAKGDPSMGATFAKWENDPMTNVQSVVKKDGTPNTFIVTFFNEDGKAQFISDFLEDDLLGEVGYALGFPEGTFIDGSYNDEGTFVAGTNTNGNGLTSHIYYTEAVELTVKPVLGKVCEGYDGIPVLVTAKGKVKGTDYSTPYWLDKDAETVNPAASKIELNAEVEVTIEGIDINNKDVKLTAILKNLPAKELWNCKDYDSKDIFYISYPRYSFDEDNGTDYKLTIPEGAFTINKCQTKKFEGSVDVLAHPIWEATVAPYTFEEGKTETSTLTLNCKVTLTDNDGDFEDDKAKKFEKQVQKWHETRTIKDEEGNKTDVQIISVDDTPVTSWTLTNISADQTDENGLKYRTFDVVLELANPIKDVAEHKVNVYEFAFRANVCHSKDMELTAYPKITYGIEQVKYVVSTEAKSVSYNLYAILPDGSRLDKVVGYVGETDPEKLDKSNAIAFNDGTNTDPYKYPVVAVAATTSESEKDGEAVTEYTLNFPKNSLKQNQYKMNFPVGTLQVEGYIANESPLAVPFDVVDAIEFDATSNEEHYNAPATDPKDKVYNISTTDTEITLYLTGLDLWEVANGFDGNANKVIKLVDGDDTKLGFSSDEVLKLKNIEDGKFTVTFTKDDKATGLEEGTYKLTVPAKSVMNKNAVKLFEAGDIMVDEEKYIYNPEAFVLTINVLPAVDFIMDPKDDPYTEETTEFVVKVNESAVATTFVGSTPAYITGGTLDKPVNVTLTPIEDKPGFMTVTGFGTLAKGEYTITSPVGGLKANNSVQKTEVSGDFEVVKAFVFNDDFQPESGVHVSTKAEDVVAGTYDVLTYKRTFNTTGYQALNLPFSIVYDEKVSDKVELYRISFFHNPDANGNGELDDDEVNNAILELRPLKEGDKTIANKPYVVKAKETGNVIIDFTEKEMVEPKPDFVECSTVFNKYTFTTNTEVIEQSVLKADNKYILTGGKIQGAGGFLRYWRWYMTTTELGLPNDFYVKFAVDGELYDEDGFATGIKLIDASDVQGDVYNVAGQRLNAPAKGQVNIVNGKKIFVK